MIRRVYIGFCYACDVAGIVLLALPLTFLVVLLLALFESVLGVLYRDIRQWATGDVPAFFEAANKLRTRRLAATVGAGKL